MEAAHAAQFEATRPNSTGIRPNSTSLEVGELGADGELGGAPEDRVDVGVHDLDDLAGQLVDGDPLGVGGVAELGEGRLDLLEAFAAVGEVVVEDGAGRRR